MSKPSFKKTRAMTLVEVLVAVFVLTIGILASLLFFTRAMKATQSAQDLTLATTIAEGVLEEMRLRPTLTDIQQTDWSSWREGAGFNSLPGEQLAVTYANPGGNPLQIEAKVSWDRSGRPGEVKLATEMTK
jgi:type IV pilus modification protein PilV